MDRYIRNLNKFLFHRATEMEKYAQNKSNTTPYEATDKVLKKQLEKHNKPNFGKRQLVEMPIVVQIKQQNNRYSIKMVTTFLIKTYHYERRLCRY